MMTKDAMPKHLDQDDAQLVSECLAGGRDAFGRIVERYQSLICSLAYSATGSLTQSEDLAQETFVAAWTQLPELREPAKLRPWLCGIARNLIGKALRRDGREPVHAAQPLEAAQDSPAVAPLPVENVMSEEEKTILWRSLERIPEIYREPLVLFYRQHQSVENVAAALDLTEETVRQRLSRGRKLLQEQVLAFVEGALESTNPTAAFTAGVMASLPLVASTTAVASVGSAAAKSGATAKTAIGFAAVGTISAGAFFLFSSIGLLIFLGGCVGYMMSRAVQRSPRQVDYVIRFWRALAIGFGIFVVLPLALVLGLRQAPGSYFEVYNALNYWIGLIVVTVMVALVIWFWRWKRTTTTGEFPQPSLKRFYIWLSLGMLVPTVCFAMFVYEIGFHESLTHQRLTGPELQRLIAEHTDVDFTVMQYRTGSKELCIWLPKSRASFHIDANPKVLALLSENHIAYKTCVPSDFDQLGISWLLLGMLALFVTPIGLFAFLRCPRNGALAKELLGAPEKNSSKGNGVFRAFAAAVALVPVSGVIFLGLATSWGDRKITASELPAIMSEYRSARFQVWKYSDGSSVLQIFPHNAAIGPFVVPATEQTLSLLNQSGIPFRTIVQGRDFGYRIPPGPAASLAIMIVLTAGALILLKLAVKGTIICTLAFGATFLAVFLVLFGMSLRDISHRPKLYVSTARVKVSEWSDPGFSAQDEKSVVTSKPVLEPVIRNLDLGTRWGSPERAFARLSGGAWVEIITNAQGGVFEVSVDDAAPNGAADLANGIAKSYCDFRNQKQIVAQVLDPAVPNPKPYSSPSALFVLRGLSALLAGFVAGLVAAGVAALWKRRKTV